MNRRETALAWLAFVAANAPFASLWACDRSWTAAVGHGCLWPPSNNSKNPADMPIEWIAACGAVS